MARIKLCFPALVYERECAPMHAYYVRTYVRTYGRTDIRTYVCTYA